MILASLLSLLFVTAPPLAAAPNERCLQPNATIEDCPDHYHSRLKDHPDPAEVRAADQAATQAAQAIAAEHYAADLWKKAKQKLASAPTDSFWDLINGTHSDAYGKAARELRDADAAWEARRRETDAATALAVTAASEAYGLVPPKTDFSNGGTPGKWPMPWNPAFSRREKRDPVTGEIRMKTPDELDAETLMLAARPGPIGLAPRKPTAGVTSNATGSIGLYQTAFETGKAEDLAAMIVHETTHWVQVMSVGSRKDVTLLESFQGEVEAYRRMGKFYEKAGQAQTALACAATADQYAVQIKILLYRRASQKIPDEQVAVLYPGWLGAHGESQGRLMADDGRTGLVVDRDALRIISDGSQNLHDRLRLQAEERLMSSETEANDGEYRRLIHAWTVEEASRCGFEPTDSSNNRFRSRGLDEHITIHVQRAEAEQSSLRDSDQFKASLSLVWACATKGTRPPCNNAIDTIVSDWGDVRFRKALYLFDDSDEPISSCVATLINDIRQPQGFGDFQRTAKHYWEQRAPGRPQTPPAGSDAEKPPQTPRPPRERQDPPPQRPYVPPCMQGPGRRCIH